MFGLIGPKGCCSFRQDFNNGRCNVGKTVNARGHWFAMFAPNDGGHWIESVVAQRQVFDVAVIAGQDYCRAPQIEFIQERTNEKRERAQDTGRRQVVLCVTYLVGDEVFIEREFVARDNARQLPRLLFRACANRSPRLVQSARHW